MAEDPSPEQTEAPAPPEVPVSSPTERLFVRVSIWQTVLSVAGVFIGVVALYAALTESDAARKQTAAAVWPYLQLEVSDYANEHGAEFAMALRNAGVGPARVRTMEVLIGGEPVADWGEAVRRLRSEGNPAFGRNFIIGRVLAPAESVTLVQTMDPALVAAFRDAVSRPGTRLQFCYCSIFDDCWLRDSANEAADPQPVSACPDFGAAGFQY